MPSEKFMRHHYGASGYVPPQPDEQTPKGGGLSMATDDRQDRLNRAVLYALQHGCFHPVPEPRPGATVDELRKWGAMHNLHKAMADFFREAE